MRLTDTTICSDLGTYHLAPGSYSVRAQTSDGVGPYSFVVRTP